MTGPDDMTAALGAVLADPVFIRSPALARLLEYLVEQTIAGRGKTLKSWSVAVDGLGKSPDFDSQIDSYARVLVVRLRKALDTYYAGPGAQQAQRLAIESGSYEVLLLPNGTAAQPEPVGPAPRIPAQYRRQIAIAAVAALVLAILLAVQWRASSLAAAQRWRTSNFPFVDVSVEAEGGGRGEAELARHMRQAIITNMDDYEGVRVAYDPSDAAAYRVRVVIRKSQTGYEEEIVVIDRALNRLIWSESHDMRFDGSDDELSSDPFLAQSVFRIVHPTGIIHSNERRRFQGTDTPYGCWLRFTLLLQNNPSRDDDELARCAQGWQAAVPNHPLAAALRGWSLTNKSIAQFTDAGRKNTLNEAASVLESARAMNPNSPLLQVTSMRVYAFTGDTAAMRAAATQALRLNPRNLDIQGVTGMTLTLQNDPQGEALLNAAIAGHFNPPPWYFVGTFVAAMMRDDLPGTQRALAQLKGFRHTLPVTAILSAAYEARSGHVERARAEWARAVEMQPILRVKPDIFYTRVPISPPVRARLEQWLAPVFAK